MSDKDSESSCEWIVLDEEKEDEKEMETFDSEEELSSEPILGPLPLSTESLHSSASGEELELEWQDDPIEFYDLSSYGLSHMENVKQNNNYLEAENEVKSSFQFDALTHMKNLDCEAEKGLQSSSQSDGTSMDVSDQQSSADELDLNLSTVHKIHCYKHTRNENLNFILNLMLVVSVSSVVGLGTGYFLGWSHKCWTHMIEDKDRLDGHIIMDLENMKQTVASLRPIVNGLLDRQQLSGNSLQHSLRPANYVKIAVAASSFVQAENIPISSKDADETSTQETNMLLSNTSSVGNIVDPVLGLDYSQMHEIMVPTSIVDENNQIGCGSNVNTAVDTNSGFKNEFRNLESENSGCVNNGKQNRCSLNLMDNDDINSKQSAFNSELKHLESVAEDYQDLHPSDPNDGNSGHAKLEYDMISLESKMFDKFKLVGNKPNKPNFTYQLQDDLIEIMQSLKVFTASQLTDSVALNELKSFYSELQNTVVSKIKFIENFVENEEFKKFPKPRIKHLRRMVYSLIDSLDAIVKRSIKMSQKPNKQGNSSKICKSLFKIIFNFNKNWARDQKVWSQNLERFRQKEQRSNRFKDSSKNKRFYKKVSKNWKRRNISEKQFHSKQMKH